MGTWGPGPFDSDGAADFLAEAADASPARTVSATLRALARSTPEARVDVDEGSAGWAACELVALSFGRGEAAGDRVAEMVTRIKPTDTLRLLALRALPRVSDPRTSELAALHHEGSGGPAFDARMEDLRARLETAADGPLAVPRARAGDVIALPGDPLVVVQVLGAHEVALVLGAHPDDRSALAAAKAAPARRLLATAAKLVRQGRVLGKLPRRKDLRGDDWYVREYYLDGYELRRPGGGFVRDAAFDEVRDGRPFVVLDAERLRRIALGTEAAPRVRSPLELEAELAERCAGRWAEARARTTPGPFGDPGALERLLSWIEESNVEDVVRVLADDAGNPSANERIHYAFAGLVAAWRGTLEPASVLVGRLPPPPETKLLAQAVETARVFAAYQLAHGSDLRRQWQAGPDGGAAYRAHVAALQAALG